MNVTIPAWSIAEFSQSTFFSFLYETRRLYYKPCHCYQYAKNTNKKTSRLANKLFEGTATIICRGRVTRKRSVSSWGVLTSTIAWKKSGLGVEGGARFHQRGQRRWQKRKEKKTRENDKWTKYRRKSIKATKTTRATERHVNKTANETRKRVGEKRVWGKAVCDRPGRQAERGHLPSIRRTITSLSFSLASAEYRTKTLKSNTEK